MKDLHLNMWVAESDEKVGCTVHRVRPEDLIVQEFQVVLHSTISVTYGKGIKCEHSFMSCCLIG